MNTVPHLITSVNEIDLYSILCTMDSCNMIMLPTNQDDNLFNIKDKDDCTKGFTDYIHVIKY